MGIKDLRKFLRDRNVNCFFKIPLIKLKNTHMAIDAFNWLFTYINPVIKRQINNLKDILDDIDEEIILRGLIEEFIKFNLKLLHNNITPIWIWDGKSKIIKKNTQDKRKEAKKKMLQEKENIKNIFKNLSVFERNNHELIIKYKKLLVNTVYISKKNIEELKLFSENSGIPSITAPHEAEAMASSLAINNIIKSIWSADTDTYAIGAPFVIKGFVYEEGTLLAESVYTPNILSELSFTYAQFRDFCILLGTDFNERIYKMGPVKSFNLISKYKNIEEINNNTEYMLKDYQEIREELSPFKTSYTKQDFICKNIENNYDIPTEFVDDNIKGKLSLNDKLFILKDKKSKNIIVNNYSYKFCDIEYYDKFIKEIYRMSKLVSST